MDYLNNSMPSEEELLSLAQGYLRDKKHGLKPPLITLSDKEIEVLFRKSRLLREQEKRDYAELQNEHTLTVMPPWRKRELGIESEQTFYEV
jgi:hypothetical protein